jgi:hypothetical protein
MKILGPMLLLLIAAAPTWAADEDEPTLFEQLMIRPQRDIFSEGDIKREKIERSLPGMTDAEPPQSGWDTFIDMIANADVNQASPQQRVMIEKLNDPDFNRLPR